MVTVLFQLQCVQHMKSMHVEAILSNYIYLDSFFDDAPIHIWCMSMAQYNTNQYL